MLPDDAALENHGHHQVGHISRPQARKTLQSSQLHGLIGFSETIPESLDNRLRRDPELGKDLGRRDS